MPTYDYKCADCGRLFEKFHGMNEQPQVICPDCQSVNTARQASLGAGIIFKGAGFYVNDYKKTDSGSGTKTATKTTATETAKTEGTTSTASESSRQDAGGSGASTDAQKPAKSAHSCGPGCAHG